MNGFLARVALRSNNKLLNEPTPSANAGKTPSTGGSEVSWEQLEKMTAMLAKLQPASVPGSSSDSGFRSNQPPPPAAPIMPAFSARLPIRAERSPVSLGLTLFDKSAVNSDAGADQEKPDTDAAHPRNGDDEEAVEGDGEHNRSASETGGADTACAAIEEHLFNTLMLRKKPSSATSKPPAKRHRDSGHQARCKFVDDNHGPRWLVLRGTTQLVQVTEAAAGTKRAKQVAQKLMSMANGGEDKAALVAEKARLLAQR